MPTQEPHKANYRESFLDGIENLEKYRPGGFHPVHIGDKFANSRYTVINKLGAGSFATVWLVKDEIEDSLHALKILTAEESAISQELAIVQTLLDDNDDSAKSFLLLPQNTFEHEGPNGRHLCIVTQVAGPNVYTTIDYSGPFSLPQAARASLAVCEGLACMHRRGVGHGDLHTGNLLMRISNWNELSTSAIQQCFEATTREPMVRMDGLPLDAHAPKYAVVPIKVDDSKSPLLLDGSIYVADFGLASAARKFQLLSGVLKNTLFEILTGIRFFEGVQPTQLLSLQRIIKTLGNPPPPFNDKWAEWMDELSQDPTQNTLETELDLNVAQRVRMFLTEDELPEALSDDEENALIDLLEQILCMTLRGDRVLRK